MSKWIRDTEGDFVNTALIYGIYHSPRGEVLAKMKGREFEPIGGESDFNFVELYSGTHDECERYMQALALYLGDAPTPKALLERFTRGVG